MSWVKQKLVCIICFKRFEIDKAKGNSPELVKAHNSGTKDAAILLDEDEVSVLPVQQDGGKEEKTCDLYRRFLLFVSHFFKLRTFTDRLITCAKNANSNKDGDAVRLETFCEGCAALVSEICKLYKEIQTTRLLLAWKLSKVGQLIRKSKVPMSNKLAKELKMSLKKQMSLDAVRPVDIFRASLQVKCNNAVTTELPDVVMHRGLLPDEWKFTYSATKEALIRLIAIFIIGSTRYASYHRTDANIQNSLSNLRSQRPCPKSKKRTKLSTDTAPYLNEAKITIVVKTEPGSIETETEAITNDDNAFSGSDHDDDIPEPENVGNDSDSYWSRGGALSPMSAGSDIPSDYSPPTTVVSSRKLRGNLRERRNIIVKADEDEEESDTEERKGRKLFIAKSTDDTKPGFKCPQCPKLCKDLRVLSVHVFCFHRSSVQHTCKKCGMRFKRALELQLHHKNVHAKYNANGIPIRGRAPIQSTCPQCEQVFPTRTEMYLHQSKNHKMRPHLREPERRRMRMHVQQGKFICKTCGVKCVDSIALAAHQQSHDNDDPIKKDKASRSKREERRKAARRLRERDQMDKLLDPASQPPPGKVPMGRPSWTTAVVVPKKEDETINKKLQSCLVTWKIVGKH